MRRRRWVLGLASSVALSGCGDSTTPVALVIPTFVVVGDTGGFSQLYRVQDSVETRLSAMLGSDFDPYSAAGRLVFTTNRDGNSEVYIADTMGTVTRRVTHSGAEDAHPALSPDGTVIIFVSNRSGSPRLWSVPAPALDATEFDDPVPVATGSASEIPEGAPAWSPDGATLAFTSARSGTTQIFTMPATGGSSTQITNEVGGAFSPDWSGDGHTIYYLSTAGAVHLRKISSSGGTAKAFESDSLDLDASSCDATLCLAAEDPTGDRGSILAFPAKGGKGQPVIARTHNERQAALLVP